MWEKRLDACMECMVTLYENQALAYSLVWLKSSKIMRAKVDYTKKLVEARIELYAPSLLRFIKDV